jgi:hypothetical protein
MPGGNNPTGSSTFSGNNGDRLYDVTHNDIDRSTIDIGLDSGTAAVTLRERIWWDWGDVRNWNANVGGRVNDTVDVDSDWYDGDHNLVVIATSDGTRGRVTFNSVDL